MGISYIQMERLPHLDLKLLFIEPPSVGFQTMHKHFCTFEFCTLDLTDL